MSDLNPHMKGLHSLLPRARGFSLVELMVALLMALITTLAIAQAYALFEGQKRTTASGGESQQNGLIALFQIKKDLTAAGFGIRNYDAYGCPNVAPVTITTNAGGNDPDSLTVLLGNSNTQAAPNQFQSVSGNTITVFNAYALGFQVNDWVLLHSPNTTTCDLVQITAINAPGTPTALATLTVNPAPAGAYTGYQDELYDLGQGYVARTFAVDPATNRLTQSDNGNAPVDLADNVVSLKVQYGKDDGSNGGTPDDGIVDTYNSVPPVTRVDWKRVLSVRFSVIARSPLPEKQAVSNTCTNTSGNTNNGPCPWRDTAAIPAPIVNLPVGWQNYRYFVYTTIAPIRNNLWQ